MKKINLYTLFLGALIIALSSCEDVVDIDIADSEPSLVVDAWLNNLAEAQEIKLTLSQPYFDNSFADGVDNAIVQVARDDGEIFDFEHIAGGTYRWVPSSTQTILGEVGNAFGLFIQWEGKSYSSFATLLPTTPVDEIRQFQVEDDFTRTDGLYAEFIARDLPGIGNCYWIKSYKNGEFLNKPEEINIAFDASFDTGGDTDNFIFITPIREAINPVADPLEDGEDEPSPFEPGDELRVEIHSMSVEAFRFMEIARDQLLNGSNGIFAFPLANSPGNISCEGCEQEALGLFNIGEISSLDYVFE